MLIAHISDFHIVPPPALCYGYSDTRAGLMRAVAALNGLSPRPDLVLASGDLVDEPSAEAYETLRAILAKLAIPHVLLPGNHDDRGLLARTFPEHDYLPQGGAPANFVRDLGAVRLVAFDAVIPGKEYAEPTTEGLDWLATTLAAARAQPTMLVLHHPPIPTGLAFMDAIQPAWPQRLAAILDANPQVRLVGCGHVHRLIDGMLGHARVASAGSTGHQFAFATDLDSPPRLSGEPAMIRLHLWRDGAATSFATPVDRDFATHAFEGIDDSGWKRIRAQLLGGQSRPGGATIEGA
ncbi:phosphodiesterase [Sphingomonas sp. ZT3P38]|uniref:phosphodiesterase n=1 Tax=Parasphingomonas zepuensis TaxID=3096161 RepID=UPI002FC5BD50